MNKLCGCNLVLMGNIEQEIKNIPCLDCDRKMGIDRLWRKKLEKNIDQ